MEMIGSWQWGGYDLVEIVEFVGVVVFQGIGVEDFGLYFFYWQVDMIVGLWIGREVCEVGNC